MEPQNKAKRLLKRVLTTILLLVATAVFGVISLFFILHFASNSNTYKTARAENDSLREISKETENVSFLDYTGSGYEDGEAVQLSVLDTEMLKINPDYLCWIDIEGTRIDHPVVRGYDNETYVNTSFYGGPSDLGALFMDFRNRGDRLSNIIIYGHNSHQGEMFGDLHLLLNEQFLNENRIITININGKIFEYEIFSVRLTNIYDAAYTLDFDSARAFSEFADLIEAPIQATKILTLSTCVSRGDVNARLVVQGYSLSDECISNSLNS